jgi:hypothetical protein
MIVYPFPTKIAESPLQEMLDDEDILIFHFRILPLWQLQAEHYINERAVVMYALLPTMAGVSAALLHKAIDEMVQYWRRNCAGWALYYVESERYHAATSVRFRSD